METITKTGHKLPTLNDFFATNLNLKFVLKNKGIYKVERSVNRWTYDSKINRQHLSLKETTATGQYDEYPNIYRDIQRPQTYILIVIDVLPVSALVESD